MNLKKLSEQVVVITGASSGIGLVTARKMAQKGAKLVLAARSENALDHLVNEIVSAGGQAIAVVADVGVEADVEKISEAAIARFGGFDTWVNNAGVGLFAKFEETPLEDMKRLFDTNVWGVVHGSLVAIKTLRSRGGALINLGSVVAHRVAHMQGVYSASKFAVKAFTDTIRMDLEADGAPVSVTLINPSAIDTPFAINAKNHTDRVFQLPPPVYAPDLVADAILDSAEHPHRDVFIGGGGRALAASETLAPRITDKIMATRAFTEIQKKDEPARPVDWNGLDRPSENLRERGNYDGHVMEKSLYTSAVLNPVVSTLALFGLGLGIAALWHQTQKPQPLRLPASTIPNDRALVPVRRDA